MDKGMIQSQGGMEREGALPGRWAIYKVRTVHFSFTIFWSQLTTGNLKAWKTKLQARENYCIYNSLLFGLCLPYLQATFNRADWPFLLETVLFVLLWHSLESPQVLPFLSHYRICGSPRSVRTSCGNFFFPECFTLPSIILYITFEEVLSFLPRASVLLFLTAC